MNLPQKTLSQKTLAKIANNQAVQSPNYDRENISIGIVHLGPGAFHRAHQAVYI
jgi:fructuronate reductase